MEILVNKPKHYMDKLETTNMSILNEYKENALMLAQLKYPNVPKEKLEEFITNLMKMNYEPLPIRYLHSHTKGNIEVVKPDTHDHCDFLSYLSIQDNNIRTPYGASYCRPDERESMFSKIITDRQASRKEVKKDMILAEARGDEQTRLLKYFRQLYIKTSINIYSGVMKSNTNFKSHISYNAITSISRFGIMMGYSFVERMLGGNFYFKTYNDVVNWTITLLREKPKDNKLQFLIDDFKLPVITTEMAAQHFSDQIMKYDSSFDINQLINFFSRMSPTELAFVYYGSNLKAVFFDSPELRTFTSDIISLDNVVPYEGKIGSIFTLPDESIFIYTLVLIADSLKDAEGNNITHDRIDKEFPEIAKRIYDVYHSVESRMHRIESLFNTFVLVESLPHDVIEHKNMKREVVVLSDTDSILFSTAGWVEWLFNGPEVSDRAANVSAFVILLACKALVHVFRTIDSRMGMMEEHIDTLSMKNEYMYDVFLRVVHAKSYAGFNSYKEGAKLPKRKLDIKGRVFIDSNLCSETTDHMKKFFTDVFNITSDKDKILTSDWLLRYVIRFEQKILKNVKSGSHKFFKTTPIKSKANYAKPLSSSYFYYLLWDEIFKESYGVMDIPAKTKVISLSESSVNALESNPDLNPEFREKLVAFLRKYKKKSLMAVYIPLDRDIPKELDPIVDYRKCITTNCFGFYLLLRSFEITVPFVSKKEPRLLSDVYVGIVSEIANEKDIPSEG